MRTWACKTSRNYRPKGKALCRDSESRLLRMGLAALAVKCRNRISVCIFRAGSGGRVVKGRSWGALIGRVPKAKLRLPSGSSGFCGFMLVCKVVYLRSTIDLCGRMAYISEGLRMGLNGSARVPALRAWWSLATQLLWFLGIVMGPMGPMLCKWVSGNA